MAKPVPNLIKNYPEGQLHHLFTKILTASDIKYGLTLMGQASKDYLQGFKDQVVKTMLHTPALSEPVIFKAGNRTMSLCTSGWGVIVTGNGFVAGDIINCWFVYEEESRVLNLIMERAANESAGPAAQQAEAGGDAGQAAGAGGNGKGGQQ
ncbi:hypothetical protein POTOM_043814 [Populus tomentosa]|uniref:Uncharacterized protein n=1 Tax=Populus tomentosa TaxID=118781 RepID=A0A8X7YL72_POPTO|nr:hypothetical protein POTOM_043814 [Populus tomentosa]